MNLPEDNLYKYTHQQIIYTYQQIINKAAQTANALKNAGIKKGDRIAILSCGYILQRLLKNWNEVTDGIDIGLVDVFRNIPLNLEGLQPIFEKYNQIITVEEQCLSGGFGSAILEAISDLDMVNSVKRLGLEARYYFENGGREFLLNKFGLSNEEILQATEKF